MTRTFLLLLCILQCPGRFQSSPVVPASVVKLWASVFGGEIKSITAKYSGAQLLQKKYKEQSVTVQKIDGIKLVKKLAENMEQMFHKKAEAIKRLVEAAEEAHLNHQEDPELQFEYFNAVLINEQDEEGERVGEELMVEPNQHFNNLSVNLSLSVVQVPTNMYNQDSALVNGVFWSEALNRVFVQNFRKDPALMWQYFGSAKGFFRQYPGMKWTAEEHGVLEFDCRNRKWYIQAATSPKDVVVLLDVSGSMKGLRLTIARQTVSSILDTLGDDDFFNVIAYNEQLHYVEPCMNGSLVQADSSKKDHFRHRLEKLSAKGIGMLDLALKEAFELLDNFNQTGRGSVCSQAIMLVTDGAVETYEAVFEEYNWPERKVRIFPYLIGRESVFAENLKWMACANKGYFTQISTLADVQENVMKYLHVLSRPKVMDHEHDMVWTEAYVDNTLRDAYGPVLMTTVAMPVFSSKNETSDQGVLLGVVGTDVPVSEILRAVPKFKLGIHGYAFAITNNGFVLTHPDLRPLYEDSRRSRSKRRSGHHSVDLSELELEDTEDELRNAMVNRETGVFSMSVKKSVDKGKRVLVLHHHYYYTHIRGTPFSVAVTLSGGHGERLFRGNISILEGLQDLEHPDVLLAEGWTYCSTEDHPEHLILTQADAIRLFYEGEADVTCDEDLVRELVFDAAVTAPLEAYWTSLSLNKSENTDGGLEMAFLSTRTGLSRLGLFLTPDLLSSQDVLSADDKESAFSVDHFPLWYKRSAEQLPGTFLYSLPFSTGSENRNVVLASSAIHLSDDRESPIAAVVGVQMKLAFFQRKFWTACRQCATLDRRCSVSCDSEDISCFLIDNNGFILVSEDPAQTGLFFGEVEGSVMNRLVSMGSFIRVELYDFQAVCRVYTQSSDTAHTLTHPFFAVFAALRWLLTEILLFLLEFSVLRCWSSGATAHSGRVRYVSCGKEYPAFVSERTIKETVGSIDCEDCVKSFVIQQIPSSNLFIIVTDNTCDCSRLGSATLQPNDIIYNESVTCERLMLHRKRRRPDTCHAVQQQEEDSLECGASSGVFASRTTTVFLLLFSVFVL